MNRIAKGSATHLLRILPMAKFALLVSVALVSSAHAQDGSPLPQPLKLPQALIDKTRFEPSGAAWIAEASAFLVVSDDTGIQDTENDGAPILFLVSLEGDVSLLDMRGLPDSVSDLEAVTRSPDGDLWLLCSQSKSKKGKRPDKRQWLIQAKYVARTDDGPAHVQVSNHAKLFGRLPEVRRHDDLDLEGCAWLDGTLLLGVKEPLTDRGEAQVWKLANPKSLFDPDVPCDVTTFATFALPTGAEEKHGGVSDLLVAGGVLYILSTLPAGPDCGSLWKVSLDKVVSRQGGSTELSKVATWGNVKPEGCALDKEGRLRVFFDMTPPSWCPLDR
jgi:hypothetical protein